MSSENDFNGVPNPNQNIFEAIKRLFQGSVSKVMLEVNKFLTVDERLPKVLFSNI